MEKANHPLDELDELTNSVYKTTEFKSTQPELVASHILLIQLFPFGYHNCYSILFVASQTTEMQPNWKMCAS